MPDKTQISPNTPQRFKFDAHWTHRLNREINDVKARAVCAPGNGGDNFRDDGPPRDNPAHFDVEYSRRDVHGVVCDELGGGGGRLGGHFWLKSIFKDEFRWVEHDRRDNDQKNIKNK